jgi:hypothetical protein
MASDILTIYQQDKPVFEHLNPDNKFSVALSSPKSFEVFIG